MSARCISCGCTEERACTVVMPGSLLPCWWVLVNRAEGEGLCSACAPLPLLVFKLMSPSSFESRIVVEYSVRDLADMSGRSPRQVRRALAHLEEQGLVERKQYGLVHGVELWRRLEAQS